MAAPHFCCYRNDAYISVIGIPLRIIGPSKLPILRTLPLLYRFVHPSIGGSKILRAIVFFCVM